MTTRRQTPCEEVRQRHSRLHSKHLRVQWTETHGAGEILDGVVRITPLGSQEAAEEPSGRQVRIERKRPVDQCNAAIEVAHEMRERMATSGECDRIVLAQFNGSGLRRWGL
jgi:hypothetical protein